jgi:hypothetical protein
MAGPHGSPGNRVVGTRHQAAEWNCGNCNSNFMPVAVQRRGGSPQRSKQPPTQKVKTRAGKK